MNTTTRTKFHRAGYSAVGAALLIGLAGLSSASDTALPETHSKTIRYDDLDLSKPAGAKALFSRIRVAAREVCSFSADWPQSVTDRACVENAIDGAVRKVNSPTLTRLRFGNETRLASK